MRILMRCDGGRETGVGHVLRSLAVAQEALRRGHEVEVLGHVEGDLARGLLHANGVRLREVPPGSFLDGPSLVEVSADADVLHVDSYDVDDALLTSWGASGRSKATQTGRPLLSNVADGTFGARPADLTVDQTLGAERRHPAAPSSWNLRGARYALLRGEVVRGRVARSGAAQGQLRVLVVLGGTDPRRMAPTVVDALAATGLNLAVDVIATSGTRAALDGRVARFPGNLLVHGTVQELTPLMAGADLVVSAAGSSVWELCALAVPMALVAVVDNQRPGYDEVVDRRAALGLGDPDDLADVAQVSAQLRDVLADAAARADLSRRAGALVDGLGTWRLVSAWESVRGGATPDIPPDRVRSDLEVRLVTMHDGQTLFEWRNDPATRAVSRDPSPLDLESHLSWLAASLRRDDRVLLMAEIGGRPVGTVRWDRQEDRRWEVSITVAPHVRGARLAVPILAAGEKALADQVDRPGGVRGWIATVHVDNEPSMRLFASSGYLPDLPPDEAGFAGFHKAAIV